MYRVMLVDDEVVAVNALNRRVDWSKYDVDDVLVANSMTQAQELFAAWKIDFMLCDIEMPQGSGLDLFEWVKIKYPETECIYVTCHPDFEYVRKAMKLGSLDYILKPIDYDELDEILKNTIARLKKKNAAVVPPADAVLQQIMARENQSIGSSVTEQVKKFIIDHLSETIHVEDIAKTVHLNPQYLMRVFKKETSMPILEYITSERVKIAKDLLAQTDLPINRVADCVGYDNYSYFIKIIKRYTGMTPVVFRKKHKKDAK
jgi:YesN/AraC family two-component response regulator